jgi:beta-xylosidase
MSQRIVYLLLFYISLSACPVFAQRSDAARIAESKYVFTYFKGNGEDGLHLAVSNDGLKWEALKNDSSFLVPAVGQDKLMRDPAIIFGPDKKYHLTWTVSWREKSIGYAESDDLIHWSEQKLIPAMEHEKDALNCWAPEIFYDDIEKQYMFFWASTIPGRFPETDGQDKLSDGNYLNHRIYYVTTRDFKNFSETKILYDHGFNVIDATIVNDGIRYVMFLKDETNKPFVPQKNIRLAYSEKPTGPYSKPSGPVTGKYWAEGPTVLKTGAKWFVYFDKYTEHKYGLIVSEDLVNWKDISDELILPDGLRHGTVIEINH